MTLKVFGQLALVIVVATLAAGSIGSLFHSPALAFFLGLIFGGAGSTFVLARAA